MRIDTKGVIHLSTRDGRALNTGAMTVVPPAMLSWSLRSDAFFINDGEGSGISSVLRLFRVAAYGVTEDPTIHKGALSRFRIKRSVNRQTRNNLCGDLAGFEKEPNYIYSFKIDLTS